MIGTRFFTADGFHWPVILAWITFWLIALPWSVGWFIALIFNFFGRNNDRRY